MRLDQARREFLASLITRPEAREAMGLTQLDVAVDPFAESIINSAGAVIAEHFSNVRVRISTEKVGTSVADASGVVSYIGPQLRVKFRVEHDVLCLDPTAVLRVLHSYADFPVEVIVDVECSSGPITQAAGGMHLSPWSAGRAPLKQEDTRTMTNEDFAEEMRRRREAKSTSRK